MISRQRSIVIAYHHWNNYLLFLLQNLDKEVRRCLRREKLVREASKTMRLIRKDERLNLLETPRTERSKYSSRLLERNLLVSVALDSEQRRRELLHVPCGRAIPRQRDVVLRVVKPLGSGEIGAGANREVAKSTTATRSSNFKRIRNVIESMLCNPVEDWSIRDARGKNVTVARECLHCVKAAVGETIDPDPRRIDLRACA